MKVLVTAIGGRAAYNLVRCIRESEIGSRVSFVGADMSDNHSRLLCDEFVVIPSPKSSDYVPAMQKIVREMDIDLVIPTSDEECLALAKNRAQLGNIKTLPMGSFEGIMSSKDKLALYENTKHLDIVPKTSEIKNGAGIAEIKNLVGLPAFIKPRMGRGGRYTHIVRYESAGEEKKLAEYWNAFDDDFGAPVCQQFIESSDYGIDAYADSSGKIFFGALRKKLSVAVGDRIVGMRAVSVAEQGMEAVCRKIAGIFCLRGLFEIEMRRDASGKFYAIDVNPRVGGSIYLSKLSRRNIAILPVLDYLGENYPEFDYVPGAEYVRREIEKDNRKFFWDFESAQAISDASGLPGQKEVF